MTTQMTVADKVALGLATIGALNWGLVGFFQFDLVATLLGGPTAILSRIVYGLVGLAGLYCVGLFFRGENAPATA